MQNILSSVPAPIEFKSSSYMYYISSTRIVLFHAFTLVMHFPKNKFFPFYMCPMKYTKCELERKMEYFFLN